MQATRMIKRALDATEASGAVAGGMLPGTALAQYWLHDLPAYYRAVRNAPEVSWRKLDKVLQPGDIGLGGMYSQPDIGTGMLNYGSFYMSGGPGTHAQIVGPRVRRNGRRVLSLFHGGQHEGLNIWGGQRRSALALAHAINTAEKWRNIPTLYRDLVKDDIKATAKAFLRRGKSSLLNTADTVKSDAAHHTGIWDRPYIYLRRAAGPLKKGKLETAALRQLLLREAVAPYDVIGAAGAGLKSLFIPRTGGLLSKALGGIGGSRPSLGCTSHHCGSMAMQVAQQLNMAPKHLSPRMSLPSHQLLNPLLTPVAVVNKAEMLSGLRHAALGRSVLGLGATALGALSGTSLLDSGSRKLKDIALGAFGSGKTAEVVCPHVQQMLKKKLAT